jgi:hypothetical protein
MSPKLTRTVWRARLALIWERLWAAAYPLVMVLALFAMAVLTGLLGVLPDLARYAALALFALAFIWALRPLFRLALPARGEALRRIETASALDHRPVSASEDRPANPSALSSAIWEEHVARQLAKLKRLSAGTPRSDLKWRDPYALRLAALLGVLAAAFLYRGDPVSNFVDAVRIAPSQAQLALSLDAWVRPPAYTAKPPSSSPARRSRKGCSATAISWCRKAASWCCVSRAPKSRSSPSSA